MGDTTGMNRLFDVPTYQPSRAGWNVEKIVNVAAATGRALDRRDARARPAGRADGHPDAIVGGLPPTESVRRGDRAHRPADGGAAFPWRAADGPVRRARCRRATCCAALARARAGVRADGAHRPARRPRPRALAASRRAGRRGRAHRLAAVGDRRRVRARGRRASTPSPRSGGNVVCKLSRPGDAAGLDARRRVPALDRARDRARSASTAACSPATSPSTACTAPSTSLYATFSEVTPGSTTSRATSCSPPTPNGCTGSDGPRAQRPRRHRHRRLRGHRPRHRERASPPKGAHVLLCGRDDARGAVTREIRRRSAATPTPCIVDVEAAGAAEAIVAECQRGVRPHRHPHQQRRRHVRPVS